MLHWLHSLLPHLPRYGFVLIFIVVFLDNLGFPLPGKTILFGAGFIPGKTGGSLRRPMAAGTTACFLGGTCAFWLGRRLGHGRLEKIRPTACEGAPTGGIFAVLNSMECSPDSFLRVQKLQFP